MKIKTQEISLPLLVEKEIRLFIKRIDQTHPIISGNKWYKLKYNLNGSAKFLSEYGQKREHLSEGRIFDLFENFGYIIPQGSVMSSLGNHYKLASLSNKSKIVESY